jgi:hypothetical protein
MKDGFAIHLSSDVDDAQRDKKEALKQKNRRITLDRDYEQTEEEKQIMNEGLEKQGAAIIIKFESVDQEQFSVRQRSAYQPAFATHTSCKRAPRNTRRTSSGRN